MRIRLHLLPTLVALATALPAQRPDLSGTWVASPGTAPAALPAAPSAVLGARFGLALDATTVTVTRLSGEFSLAVTFPLDGGRTAFTVPGRLCEGERTVYESAAWDGDALVLTVLGSIPAGGGTAVTSNARRLIRREGPDRIVVEATMMQQGQQRQVGAVYVRSTEPLPAARPAPPVAMAPATIQRVAWIGADWRGTTGALTTEERWTPPASGGMLATARTLRGGALASFEFLCIAERGGSLVYVAMPDGRTTPTLFHLTAVTDTSATFENPSNDYPQLIRYLRTAAGALETTISASDGSRARTVSLPRATP